MREPTKNSVGARVLKMCTQAGRGDALGFSTYPEAADLIPRLAEADAHTSFFLKRPTATLGGGAAPGPRFVFVTSGCKKA